MAKSKKDWEKEAARKFEGMRHFRGFDDSDEEPKEHAKTRRELDEEAVRNFEGPRRYEW